MNKLQEYKGIRIGDFITFLYFDKEIKGMVESIDNNIFHIKSNNKLIDTNFNNIIEHYPRNESFNKKIEKPIIKKPEKNIIKDNVQPTIDPDFRKDPNFNNENKNIIFFPDNISQKKINEYFQLSKTDAKYFILEKNKELHIVRVNENGFNIKSFIETLISTLKEKDIIKEDISTMKLVGNDNFVILQNASNEFKSIIKNSLKLILK